MKVPDAILNDGNKMPFFGFGTYQLKGEEAEEAIKYAIDVGYRHIDTAYLYENEIEVGNAVREKIKDGTVKREDLFITTKLGILFHKQEDVVACCQKSLQNLGLSYVDLYLIHTPVSQKVVSGSHDSVPSDIDYLETWRGMEKCKEYGLTRSIGVSNFNSEQITRIIYNCSIKPSNNQIEVTLNLNQKRLIDFCSKYHIIVTGFSPLGRPGKKHQDVNDALINPRVQELSKKYGKTPAQISLRFVLQMGAAPIPKSATKSRIKENIEIFDFSLTDSEMKDLRSIETGQRLTRLLAAKNAMYYPFNIPF